jgi:hypothetical protein
MIKRIQLVRRLRSLPAPDFDAGWTAALARAVAEAPEAVQPLRAVACLALPLEGEPLHDGISMLWFADVAALQRHERWQRSAGLQPSAAELLDSSRTLELVTREVVLRGAEWLVQRWRSREPKFKHMALARRARGLTAAEFSERWRKRPGQIGGEQTPSLAIPEAAKGRAYCQNHPLPDCQSADTDPGYDAVNEVYFDRLEDMQARIAFFRDHPVAQLDADLVSEPAFLIVREQVLPLSAALAT